MPAHRGFSSDAIAAIKRAYKTLYRSGLQLADAQTQIVAQLEATPELAPLVEFLATSARGIVR